MGPEHIVFIIIAVFILLSIIAGRRASRSLGELGEKRVAKRLSKLPKDRYRIINDLLLQDNKYSSQIDHVVISEYGIFVIETKNYSGKIYGGGDSDTWRQFSYGKEYPFRNPLKQNNGHIYALQNIIGEDARNCFHSIILFSEDAKLRVGKGLPVYNWRKIVPIIEGYTTKVLTTEKADRIYRHLLAANNTDKKARKAHIQSVQEKKRLRAEAVKSGKCPVCGGNLVLRSSQYGVFTGCSNFPNCSFRIN